MLIDDIEIKIKKYDREKNFAIVNLTLLETVEIRGFITRYTETKYSRYKPVWIVNPPSKKTGKSWFHIIRFKDIELWKELEQRIIDKVIAYTNVN